MVGMQARVLQRAELQRRRLQQVEFIDEIFGNCVIYRRLNKPSAPHSPPNYPSVSALPDPTQEITVVLHHSMIQNVQ